jgi:hypothetical protein
MGGGPMIELSKKEYRDLAYEYLHEASKAALRIKSLKRNIQRIKSDITSLRAVNYGKERVDGGEPSGIEDDINRLLNMEMRYKRQIHELLTKRDDACHMIDTLTNTVGSIILMQQYINGMSAKGAYSFVGYGESQGKEYKNLALVELGYKLRRKSAVNG